MKYAKIYRTVVVTTVGLFLLASLLFGVSLYAQEPVDKEFKTFISLDNKFPISLPYYDDWFAQEIRGGESTPFAILFTEEDMNKYHGGPLRGYPEKFVNIVYYETSKDEKKYALRDLKDKKVKNTTESETGFSNGVNLIYKSDFKEGKYFSAYKKVGKHLVIFEAYASSGQDQAEVERLFVELTKSAEFRKPLSYRLFDLLFSPFNAIASGPFTFPSDRIYSVNAYYDLDSRVDWVYDYEHSTPWQESVDGWEVGKAYDGHQGTDYNMSSGASVVAAWDGDVATTTDNQSNTYPGGPIVPGNYITIYHDDDFQTRYYHLLTGSLLVGVGSSTNQGDKIAESGNTGYSSGPHLHFGVYHEGASVDPYTNSYWTSSPPVLSTQEVSGPIATSTTWVTGGVYVINGTVTINSGVTLTIEDGAIIKFLNTSSGIIVNGEMVAEGTSESPIYFTSYKDDSIGGDTNLDSSATLPSSGDWKEIKVGSGGILSAEYAVVRYGGAYPGSTANIYNNGGIIDLVNATTSDSGWFGMLLNSGTTTLNNSVVSDNIVGLKTLAASTTLNGVNFRDNSNGLTAQGSGTLELLNSNFTGGEEATYVKLTDGLKMTNYGNSASGNYKNGNFITGILSKSITLTADTMPYIINGLLTVNLGVTLNIESGSIFKSSGAQINVYGIMQTTDSSNVTYFTSLKDDAIGGDTNNDGTTTYPVAGDWKEILVYSNGTLSLENAVVRYGGKSVSGSSRSNIKNNGGTISVDSSEITNSGRYGVLHSSGTTTIIGSIINSNLYGIYFSGGSLSGYDNFISGNSTYGLYNASAFQIIFENNYWGATSGPYHASLNPSGSGDTAYGNVDFNPWLTSAP